MNVSASTTSTPKTPDKLPITTRDGVPDDVNFILNSWLKSYRKSREGWGLEPEVYYQMQHDRATGILSVASVRVVTPEGSPNTILGWMCWEPAASRIHYVYVKKEFRLSGVARSLLAELPSGHTMEYTHLTDPAWSWIKRHTRNWTHNKRPT